METRGRSLVKAVVWNVIGLISMTVVGFVATGSFSAGGLMDQHRAGVHNLSDLRARLGWHPLGAAPCMT